MMTDTFSILDEVAVTPVALMPALPAGYGPSVSTSRSITTPSGRRLQFGAPFFARGLTPSELSGSWAAVCGILRSKGLPIYASVNELQPVPAANVPARIAQRFLGQPLDHEEVNTSDAYELVNSLPSGSGWGWPYEIQSGRDLKLLVQVLREATGGDAPIGMSLPLNAKAADLRRCVESQVDYVRLLHSGESLVWMSGQIANLAAHGIVAARRLCIQLGRPELPLLLDAPIVSGDHAIKLLALGASAVNVAELIRRAMPAAETPRYESKLAENLLGVSSAPKPRELPQAERKLNELVQRLAETLQFTGLIAVTELDASCLRAMNHHVAELFGIESIANR